MLEIGRLRGRMLQEGDSRGGRGDRGDRRDARTQNGVGARAYSKSKIHRTCNIVARCNLVVAATLLESTFTWLRLYSIDVREPISQESRHFLAHVNNS